jgi:hypothetical protein
LAKETWRKAIAQRLRKAAWDRAIDDVRPFLEGQDALSLLDRDEILKELSR